ncbi:hypothetical protein ACW4TU_42285 [Streptomyces sp. QTS52]
MSGLPGPTMPAGFTRMSTGVDLGAVGGEVERRHLHSADPEPFGRGRAEPTRPR